MFRSNNLNICIPVIDKVAHEVIPGDFNGDEQLFDKMVALYNEDQTESADGFSLRDLALQCGVSII